MTAATPGLTAARQAIRSLLDERNPADGLSSYYAFYHAPDRTRIVTAPPGAARAVGYVTISRTAIDLFRALVTLRVPLGDMATAVDLIHSALAPGAAVLINAPAGYEALLGAVFELQSVERLRLLRLDAGRFEPVINVLVAQSTGANGLPRFIIRNRAGGNEVVASSGINWQTPTFAELSVHTSPGYRRQGWGRSVVSAMAHQVLEDGRVPLYAVSTENDASYQLAASLGFVDTGVEHLFLQATLRPRP